MSAAWTDWDDLQHNHLTLPVGGVAYTVAPMGYKTEQRVKLATKATAEIAVLKAQPKPDQDAIDKLSEDVVSDEEFLQLVLGDALAKMRADNVPTKAITHAGVVAHADYTHGREMAEYLWREGTNPDKMAEHLDALRAALSASITTVSTTGVRQAGKRSPKKATPKATRSRSRDASNE